MRRINIYPDPFNNKVSVEVTSEEKETTIVCLLDHSDRIIRMFSWPLKPGTNKVSVENLAALPVGTYCINIKDMSGNVLSNMKVRKEEA